MLAVLVYLAAMALPALLLYRFHSTPRFWHLLAIAVAVAAGFVPIPAELQKRGFDLGIGFVLLFLLFWGIGGLIVPRGHRERHA
jgi:hypothetical protein